jgi:RNA polymerase sigma-70 factor (ECF subfamily)
VTRNAIVDHHRVRRPAAELPPELPEAPGESAETAERDLAGCLEPLLATLAPSYRRALRLAEVEDLSQAEIARREGLSLSGAKSRVQRGRAMLRSAILDCCRVELDRRGGVVDFRRRPDGVPCGGPCGGGRRG